ncbi:MAG: hypothetical protein A2Y50_03450 [Pseudomonadales bacterium RIFCSPLOWO2_12_59_9]|nr:MAG: hypothetical protein A2Y50_03450 [Pseudomonadales bacterium RIFCSPLOWO2_12_59_9]
MSRPGCVWTHALLIEPAFLESIEQLSVLQELVIRPANPADTARYREPLAIEASLIANSSAPIDDVIVRRLLAALYAKGESAIEVASPGELDGPLFAVWSQQWPRLRRNLRFQTSASQVHRSPGVARFDITAVLGLRPEAVKTRSEEADIAWLSVAASDVQDGTKGSLRRFLWRYGQDVRRQRSSFRPLIEIKEMNSSPQEKITASRLINTVRNSFPGQEDAGLLKQDLVDGVLVSSAQAVLLCKLLYQDDPDFPPPTKTGVVRLKKLWPEQSSELLDLGEITAIATDSLGSLIFEAATSQIEASEFWALTSGYPHVRGRIFQERPELLVEDAALELDDVTLAEQLRLVPREIKGLSDLIFRLLPRKDERLAVVAFEQFPIITAAQVIQASNDPNANVAGVWAKELARRPKVLLNPEIMVLITRASLLYKLADSLGWFKPEVITAGPGPWVDALKKVSNDLWGDQEDTLNSFILTLALVSGGDEGWKAVEMLFDAVHDRVLSGRLHGQAREILVSWLPEVGWFASRDVGLRLRLLVADTYVRNKWPAKSYARLTRDIKARKMLVDAASDTPGGEPYSNAVSW